MSNTKKKLSPIKFLKEHAKTLRDIGLIFTIIIGLLAYFYPNAIVIIQKETEIHTMTETITTTSTVTATVTRANGTVEDLTKLPVAKP